MAEVGRTPGDRLVQPRLLMSICAILSPDTKALLSFVKFRDAAKRNLKILFGKKKRSDSQAQLCQQRLRQAVLPRFGTHGRARWQETTSTVGQYGPSFVFPGSSPSRAMLKALLVASQVLQEVNQDLERFGNRLLTKIQPLAWECEWNPPRVSAVRCLGTAGRSHHHLLSLEEDEGDCSRRGADC